MIDRDRTAALLTSTLAAFLFPFLGGASNVAVPDVAREYGAGATTVSWFVTSFIVVSSMLLLPAGRFADLVGRKRAFVLGAVLFGLASAAAAVAPTFAVLLAVRAAQGVGGALIAATSAAILVSVFPPAERGRVLGVNVAAVYSGLAAGPVLGGFLTHALGWRSIFVGTAVLAAITAAVARFRIRGEWADARGETFDTPGAAASALGVGLVTVGISMMKTTPLAPWLVLAGAASLALFVLRELRTPHPILDVRIFRHNRLFALSNLAALISYAATFASSYLLSRYLQEVRGLDPSRAGLLLVCGPVVQAVLSPWAGRLSDRVSPRLLASAGMAVCAVSLGGLSGIDADTSLAWIVASVGVQGLGFALFSSPNTNAVLSSVDRRLLSIATATLGTMRQAGMTLSIAAVTLLLAVHVGDVPVTPENGAGFADAMRIAFAGAAALCLAGVPLSLARGRSTPRP